MQKQRARQKTQQLEVLIALSEDPTSVPSSQLKCSISGSQLVGCDPFGFQYMLSCIPDINIIVDNYSSKIIVIM